MIQSVHKLLIVEPNPVIASGIEAVIKRSNKFRTQIAFELDIESIISTIRFFTPDIILMNPIVMGVHLDERFLTVARAKILALTTGSVDPSVLYSYDATINIGDSTETILQNLLSVVSQAENEESQHARGQWGLHQRGRG